MISKIPMSEYLALKALSGGMCSDILDRSPYHAKHDQDNKQDDASDASDKGTAFHDAFLEGIDRIAVIEASDWRTKAAKEARDIARAAGQIPMLAHKVAVIKNMTQATKEFLATSELCGAFESGQVEMTLTWDDGGVPCKARPDFLSNDKTLMVHLKSTAGSAEPDSWIRNQLIPSGYDLSAAFYERGLITVQELSVRPKSVFLICEQEPPHACSLVALSPALSDLAAMKVERAIRIWRDCLKSGKFPAYPSRICYAELPPWEAARWEEKSLRFSDDELRGGVPL